MLLVITIFTHGKNIIRIKTGKGTEEHEATSLHYLLSGTVMYVFPHVVLNVLKQKNIKYGVQGLVLCRDSSRGVEE